MIVKQKGYVIVNQYGVMSLYTFSTNRQTTWRKLLANVWMAEERWVTEEHMIGEGFKCVPATITTDEFERKQ